MAKGQLRSNREAKKPKQTQEGRFSCSRGVVGVEPEGFGYQCACKEEVTNIGWRGFDAAFFLVFFWNGGGSGFSFFLLFSWFWLLVCFWFASVRFLILHPDIDALPLPGAGPPFSLSRQRKGGEKKGASTHPR